MPKWNQAVLEVIDPSKGYVPGNVIVTSYAASRLLQKMTPEEHKEFMEQAARGMTAEERERFIEAGTRKARRMASGHNSTEATKHVRRIDQWIAGEVYELWTRD